MPDSPTDPADAVPSAAGPAGGSGAEPATHGAAETPAVAGNLDSTTGRATHATRATDRATGAIVDLAVVGAGPAGLAAAVTAADLGLTVVLLDAAPRPGGQYYRHADPRLRSAKPGPARHGWSAFTALADRLERHVRSGAVRHLTEHQVWTVSAADPAAAPEPASAAGGWLLHAVVGPEGLTARTVPARAVLFATGAYERQLPFPGWTLPGVVAAGGAQAMLKAGLVLPGQRVVVAGSGPLLLAVAASLVQAGARVPLLAEAADCTGYLRGAGDRGDRTAVLGGGLAKLGEGVGLAATLLRHRVPVRTRTAVVAVHGTERVEAVTVVRLDRSWRPLPGSEQRIACDAVAVGHGLLPQLELPVELGCRTRTLPDGSPALEVDARQATSVPGLWAAGESTGVGGAGLALVEGRLAAHGVAGTEPPAALLRRRTRLRAFAELMAAAHRPGPGWTGWVSDDTEVCRCEEVTAGEVRAAVDELGSADQRTVKLLTRAGMGWCQGRICGPAVAGLAGRDVAPGGRPLACPVPLGLLAQDPALD